jgi:hypothetical protein
MRLTTHSFEWILAGALWATLALAGQATAGPAVAEDMLAKSRALMAGADLSIQPGDWAAYRIKLAPGTDTGMATMESLVKISSPLHVDQAHPLTASQYWLEFELSDPSGQTNSRFTMKMLVDGDPLDNKAIRKMYIKGGNRPPLEVTQPWIDRGAEQNKSCERCDEGGCAARGGEVRKGAIKSLYTKLGWLKAQSVQIVLPDNKGVREYWFSKQVPMFKIVRATIDERMQLELDSYGHGSLSRIDETKAVPMPDPEEIEQQLDGAKP